MTRMWDSYQFYHRSWFQSVDICQDVLQYLCWKWAYCSSPHQVEERMRRLWLIRYKAVSSMKRSFSGPEQRFSPQQTLIWTKVEFWSYYKTKYYKIQKMLETCRSIRNLLMPFGKKDIKISYFLREIDLLAFDSEFSVGGWRIFCIVGRRLFCIQKAAPPKIPSECETNQLTMHRIQQTTPRLHLQDQLIDKEPLIKKDV